MAYVVGLTGGIGSGKSAAARLFGNLGVRVIDADAIAHELTAAGGEAMEGIRAAFGQAYVTPDGALDRARMRDLVFADAENKRCLESILHPLIRRRSEQMARGAGSEYVIMMVPLLVESQDYRARYQRILVVDCPEELQITRVTQRSGLEEGQVRAIMAAQSSRKTRLAAADDVIDNSRDLASLEHQVAALHARYMQQASDAAAAGQ